MGKKGLPVDRIGSVKHLPGFGDTSGLPEGTPFRMPAGLHLVKRPDHRFDPDIRKLKGNMNTFYVDIHVVADSTWGGGELVFPKGLVMLNISPSKIQNGMLMGRVRINVPPYSRLGGRDTLSCYLGVACINANMGFPWEDNFGSDDRNFPISKGLHVPYVTVTDQELLQFLGLLEDKEHLNLTRHHNPWDMLREDYVEPAWMKPYRIIQDRLWLMTDGPGLSREDLEELWEAIQ